MTNCFVFDSNKCVGCHACVVACANENNTVPPVSWREIHVFNQWKIPQLPVFYHSLACNHCDDPLCLKSCPAKAYYKDEHTGAIIHEPEKCFGCKYCTWACPYDAPKYNVETKLIEKCTFCNTRIADGLKPACANLCPTGALDFNVLDKTNRNTTIGFPDKNIQPNIVFTEDKNIRKGPEIAVKQTSLNGQVVKKLYELFPKKIDLKKEWVLVAFTIIVAFLTGLFSASVFSKEIPINPYFYIGLGVVGMLLSSAHLGKKLRAYRSILNVKTSWLSREIFFFSGFLLLSTFVIVASFTMPILNYLALILAIASVISVDMVYKYVEVRKVFGLHSAYITISSFLFFSLFMNFTWIVSGVLFLKLILYISRKKITITEISYGNSFITFGRIIIGFLLPVYLYFTNVQDIYIILLIIAGEVFDRIAFYKHMDVITPQKQLFKQLISGL